MAKYPCEIISGLYNDYVEVKHSDSLNITDAITIEAWVKLSQNHPAWYNTMIRRNGAYLIELGDAGTNILRAGVTNGGVLYGVDAQTPLSLNQWYHVVFTYNGSSCGIYINGILDHSVPTSVTIDSSMYNLYMGGFQGDVWETFNGTLDEVCIYNRALNSSEIKEHYEEYAQTSSTPIFQLTTDVSNETFPVWSPDGTKLAFVSDKGGNKSIWMINADGSGLFQLQGTYHICSYPDSDIDWVGSKIVFLRKFSGEDGNIWTINSDGTGVTRVINNSGIYYLCPRLSPDGAKIAFVSELDNNNGWFEPYVIDSDGTDQLQLYNGGHTDTLTWSSDSTKILYARASDHERSHTLYTVNSDGTNTTTIVSNLPANTEYAGSPDGSKIVYLSGTPTNAHIDTIDRNISIINANGADKRQLTTDSADHYFGTTSLWGPASFPHKVWSPDSSKIVFSSLITVLPKVH